MSIEEKRKLRRDLSKVADQIRTYLPEEFIVGSELTYGVDGIEAMVAVQPPIGEAVSAGFSPSVELEGESGVFIDDDTRNEVAQGLAANAVHQVRISVPSTVTPTAQ